MGEGESYLGYKMLTINFIFSTCVIPAYFGRCYKSAANVYIKLATCSRKN